ncbi:MAG: BON domain-containing protein [Candidatus Omnitrophica bacterium]|nr:BON domain-containing protein [Candidatus Omnitrophota bacterium]
MNDTPLDQKKEKLKDDPVSRYLGEGNPNTDKVIEQAQGEPSPDAKLVQDTKAAIASGVSVANQSRNIQVTADNGVVTLIGNVATQQDRMDIENKARAVAGSGHVNNNLNVVAEE